MAPFDHIPTLLVAFLGSSVGLFVLAVITDDALGVALALKHKAFDPHALQSFLLSQFGTKQALAEAGLIVTAAMSGNPDVRGAVTAAATAGALSMTASVVADIKAKVAQIAGV